MGPAQKDATHPLMIEPFIKMVSNAQALEKLFISSRVLSFKESIHHHKVAISYLKRLLIQDTLLQK